MKKGFTLIELLAVIVILAIIALIATPIVLNIIKDSKESSQLQSANFYLDAVETAIARENDITSTLKNTRCYIQESGNIICKGYDKEIEIKLLGEKPSGGKIIIKNNRIEEIKLKYESEKAVVYDDDKRLMHIIPKIYQESKNIEIPNLYNNILTPIEYDGDNWIVSDVTEKWYDYSKQEWANAVILDSNVKKKIGDIVTVDGTSPDALAMFVWIPRYEYRIEGTYGKGGTSTSNPGEIEVNFITKETKEASDTYRIHPAFNFGGEYISGIWVSKFQISQVGGNIRILPNVRTTTNREASNYFNWIKKMNNDNNIYGIDGSIMDAHMIKNSEWGAVAYLSQSRYGKYGNIDYEGADKEVYMNNSSAYYTGRSGGTYGGNSAVNKVYSDYPELTNTCTSGGFYTYDGYLLEYNTNNKTKIRDMKTVASTTGNIYGIYDMSGTAYEFTMGVFVNSEGYKWSGSSSDYNSGFEGKAGLLGEDVEGLEWPNEKYYQIYKASEGVTITSKTACNGDICYGDALSETSYWYRDGNGFISAENPWFTRGGHYSNGGYYAGIFASGNTTGRYTSVVSTRVILTQAT